MYYILCDIMNVPRIIIIAPKSIESYAKKIYIPAAKKLKGTCDPDSYDKRLEDTKRNKYVMEQFYKALLEPNRFEERDIGNATKLKEWKSKYSTFPDDGKLFLSMSGGGIKLFAFMAFLETLRKYKIPIYAYSGVSAGAIATLFDRVGMNYSTIWNVMNKDLCYALMLCPSFNLVRGLLKGKRIINFLDMALPQNLKLYNDIKNFYTTIVVANVIIDDHFLSFENVILSSNGGSGDMEICKGIFSSMCLPFFQSLKIPPDITLNSIRREKDTIKYIDVSTTPSTFSIDGGYIKNYPVDAFWGLIDPYKDVVLNVIADHPGKQIIKDNLWYKLLLMLPEMQKNSELRKIMEFWKDGNIITCSIMNNIPNKEEIKGIGLFDFDQIPLMIQAGQESARNFLKIINIEK